MLVWPTPWHDDLRRRIAAALGAIGRLARASAVGREDPAARVAMEDAVGALADQFAGTPYPPTGAAAGATALAKLVSRTEWVAGSAAIGQGPTPERASIRRVLAGAAETLELSASVVCDEAAHPALDPELADRLQAATARLHDVVRDELDAEVTSMVDERSSAIDAPPGGSHRAPVAVEQSLEPAFHARALAVATAMVSDAALQAGGLQPAAHPGPPGADPSANLRRRLVSHLSPQSVWFRNAVRGGAGLALAVAVVELTDVEHGFWVVLGTLSVLRSNALATGSTALRAVAGTAIGFVVGSALMVAVGGHTPALWALLPLAVLVSGMAPSMISFAAGQAGFTVMVVILFNIIDPSGWRVGLTRIEDVSIGCAVSIVVGLLFWPRGATAALGRALADAFVRSSGYLADAVDRLTVLDRTVDTSPAAGAAHRAYLRLDDAFRQFLTERGAKVVPVGTVANLFTGANRIRLAAYMLASLPPVPTGPNRRELESVAVAGAVLRDSYASSHRWYEEFGELLGGRRERLDPPLGRDQALEHVLGEALDDAGTRRRDDQVRVMLRMLWADQLLEAQRTVQEDLAASVELFTRRSRRRPLP